jgi:hypothetical protein
MYNTRTCCIYNSKNNQLKTRLQMEKQKRQFIANRVRIVYHTIHTLI